MLDDAGQLNQAKNARGQVTRNSYDASGAVSYGYDLSGLRTAMTAAGALVSYGYNGAGQLASVADASGVTWMGLQR